MAATADSTMTRPVAPPASGWAALGTWFEAPTAHGPLQLYLGEPQGPATHACGAALALQRASQLLDALDDWLGDAAPDWRWQPHAPTQRGPTMLRLPWRDSCHQLIAPWRWLRAWPPPPAALAARLQWPAIDAVLAIAQLALQADELQQLEPGGAVLLPASMRPGWTGQWRTRAEPETAGLAVALDDLTQPRVLPGTPPPNEATPGGGRACEVRLHQVHAVRADHLAGWRADSLQDVLSPDLAASLWQHAAAREPARCLAHGRLLPWGDGWALLVDGLGEGVGEGWVDGLGHRRAERAAQAHVLQA